MVAAGLLTRKQLDELLLINNKIKGKIVVDEIEIAGETFYAALTDSPAIHYIATALFAGGRKHLQQALEHDFPQLFTNE